jgi:hypothetical protein
MFNTPLSRRHLLASASASAAAGLLAQEAHAKAPMLNTQAPAFYRFKLGTIEATIVSDGPLPIGPATRAFKGPTEAELNKMFPITSCRLTTSCWTRISWCSTPATE